jgi:hypothetical protein
VQRTGDHLLARAVLPHYENAGVGRRDLAHGFEDGVNVGVLADDGGLALHLFLERDVLTHQAVLRQTVADDE